MSSKSQYVRYFLLFCFCFLSRILFKVISNYDSYSLFADAQRYDRLSNQILEGNFNLDIVAFIVAPLYPFTLAGIKSLSPIHWETLTIAYQFFLVSISAVYIYKIALLLFNSTRTGIWAAIIYICYPMTMWYNSTFVQETSFQSFFILFSFYLIHYLKKNSFISLIISALFLALSILTKSHITLLIPFLILVLFYHSKLKNIIVFWISFLLFCLPFGINNYIQNDVVSLSSYGSASIFLLGHSDQTYNCILHQAGEMNAVPADGCDPSIIFDTSFVYTAFGKVNALDPAKRSKLRMKYAMNWIKGNPAKFLLLKWHGLKRFILPGLDRNQYKMKFWIISFLIGMLIYIPGYFVLFKSLKKNNTIDLSHVYTVCVIITIAAIFLIFFPMNRFRVITMEPLLIIYASAFYSQINNKKTAPN